MISDLLKKKINKKQKNKRSCCKTCMKVSPKFLTASPLNSPVKEIDTYPPLITLMISLTHAIVLLRSNAKEYCFADTHQPLMSCIITLMISSTRSCIITLKGERKSIALQTLQANIVQELLNCFLHIGLHVCCFSLLIIKFVWLILLIFNFALSSQVLRDLLGTNTQFFLTRVRGFWLQISLHHGRKHIFFFSFL